jgi:hypothetical protein
VFGSLCVHLGCEWLIKTLQVKLMMDENGFGVHRKHKANTSILTQRNLYKAYEMRFLQQYVL